MKYLMLMSLAGSVLFVCYWCWEKLFGKSVTQCMKYRALVVIILVYAIPWMWLREFYSSLFDLVLPEKVMTGGEMLVSIADIKTEGDAYRTQDYGWLVFVFGIWLVVALLRLLNKVLFYFRNRAQFLKVAGKEDEDKMGKIVKRLQKELHYRRKPKIVESLKDNDTFTIGTLKPIIFLQREYDDGELEMFLKHEMVHIVRRDVLLKILLDYVCCFHWFNPFIYVLNNEFNKVCETSCDEKVLRGCNSAKRTAYARLIVKNMKEDDAQDASYGSALSRGYKNAVERVNLIMKTSSVKKWKKVVAASLFGVMVIANSLTALAYPHVYVIEEANVNIAEAAVDGDTFWLNDSTTEGYNVLLDKILYDVQFVDENGEIYPVGATAAGLLCSIFGHDIVSGYIQTHNQHDDGSCTVETYESTRCKRCDTIWVGDLVSTTEWVKCNH